jgi:hypothetical protein
LAKICYFSRGEQGNWMARAVVMGVKKMAALSQNVAQVRFVSAMIMSAIRDPSIRENPRKTAIVGQFQTCAVGFWLRFCYRLFPVRRCATLKVIRRQPMTTP